MRDEKSDDISTYVRLLQDSEDCLISSILNYSRKFEFTKYTSTLHEAWRLSVHGLSTSLIDAADLFRLQTPELHPDDDYTKDSLSSFGIIEAQKHRERGVSLPMFMGLMKYYRQTYNDLFDNSDLDMKVVQKFRLFTKRCFDRIEIAYITEWTSNTEKQLLSELQTANRNLTNEKNKYLTIFESFYSPIIIINDHNKIINFNLAASRLFTDIKIAGTLYYNKDKSDEALVLINKRLNDFVKSTLNELAFETYLDTNEGQRYFLVKLKKMLDVSEKFKGVIIILDDLTERKEMERQYEIAKSKAEEADQLKTAFLANMSHEIRTPMNAIIGFTDLLLNDKIEENEKSEYLKLILQSGNMLVKIIDDLIDISKIDTKQVNISPVQFQVSDLLAELHAVFREFIRNDESKKIDLILNIDEEDKNARLIADPNRLKQVFNNLLNNAIKFTNKGYVEFGFKAVDDNHAYFYVKDTGIGIPGDKHNRIFDRFMQLEDTYTKKYGGTGLGLTITKNIITLMRGSIWVESEPGQGTTFHFIIPINYCNEDVTENKRLQLSDIKKKLSLDKHKILIAEDEEINYYYLKEVLKKNGAKVIWAKNGLEVINLVETNPNIDLVLMDIKMPEINGLEAIKYIKVIRPELPVIAQTAFVMDNDREICLKAGCVDFIAKPVKANQLLEMIAKYIPYRVSSSID
ncbi:MAG: response regulator [Bacteroidales bacterium]|nr:response regulator [Bacteroidales bacterium]